MQENLRNINEFMKKFNEMMEGGSKERKKKQSEID